MIGVLNSLNRSDICSPLSRWAEHRMHAAAAVQRWACAKKKWHLAHPKSLYKYLPTVHTPKWADGCPSVQLCCCQCCICNLHPSVPQIMQLAAVCILLCTQLLTHLTTCAPKKDWIMQPPSWVPEKWSLNRVPENRQRRNHQTGENLWLLLKRTRSSLLT